MRDLANEILNGWDAVIAFVHDPRLPPTNNDAERALRHAVIARRIRALLHGCRPGRKRPSQASSRSSVRAADGVRTVRRATCGVEHGHADGRSRA